MLTLHKFGPAQILGPILTAITEKNPNKIHVIISEMVLLESVTNKTLV